MWNNENLLVGLVSKVTNSYVTIVSTSENAFKTNVINGEIFRGTNVGEHVVIASPGTKYLAEITEVNLEDFNTLQLTSHAKISVGYEYSTDSFFQGKMPTVGSKVYLATAEEIKLFTRKGLTLASPIPSEEKVIDGALYIDGSTSPIDLELTPSQLFNRHLLLIGATGSGKSTTSITILERLKIFNDSSRLVIIDPTGEYRDFVQTQSHFSVFILGKNSVISQSAASPLKIAEMFGAASATQRPLLLSAIESLQIVNERANHNPLFNDLNLTIKDGVLIKERQPRKDYDRARLILQEAQRKDIKHSINWEFDNLANQFVQEAVFDNKNTSNADGFFGSLSSKLLNNIDTATLRIERFISDNQANKIFDTGSAEGYAEISDFIENNPDKSVYIDLSNLYTSETELALFVDIIGSVLFKNQRSIEKGAIIPTILFLDEAHRYIGERIQKKIDNEALESVEKIAREGRKYGLYLMLSTQSPFDIPEALLGQIGSLMVHKLTSSRDLARITPYLSSDIANQIPRLDVGHSILSSTNLKFPVRIQTKQNVKINHDTGSPRFIKK